MADNIPMHEILQAWHSQTNSAYIHYHENNSQAIAANELQKIHKTAIKRTKALVLQRIETKQLDNGKTVLQTVRESLTDINSITEYITGILKDNDVNGYAKQMSTMVYKLSNVKSSNSVTKNDIINFVENMYSYLNGTENIWSQVESLRNKPGLAPINQAQLDSLYKLKNLLNQSEELNTGAIRNLLVDIFTEQGLHQFINKALLNVNETMNNLIVETLHTGKAATATVRNVKPDVEMVFQIPNPEGLKLRQVGISIKSSYTGDAKILTTTLRATLLWVNQLSSMPTMNYLSLMHPKEIARWSILSNFDRALTGTMESILGMDGTLDYAGMLMEFTHDGLHVYSAANILNSLYEMLSNNTDIVDLVPYGFRMVGGERYLRNGFEVTSGSTIYEQIQERAKATNKWLQQQHKIYFNVARCMEKLGNI